jgi:hypothetical protein
MPTNPHGETFDRATGETLGEAPTLPQPERAATGARTWAKDELTRLEHLLELARQLG